MTNSTDPVWHSALEAAPKNPEEQGQERREQSEISHTETLEDYYAARGWSIPQPEELILPDASENDPGFIEYSENPAKNDLFSLALSRIGQKTGEYAQNYAKSGVKSENAFPTIASGWSWYLAQRADPTIPLAAWEVAEMLDIFKLCRKMVRRRTGVPIKRDDNIDRAGYLWWADKLEQE